VNFLSGCYPGGVAGDSVGGEPVQGISFPEINNDGTISFACAQIGVCTTSAVVAQNGTVIGGTTLTSAFAPAINNSGVIAFIGNFSTASGTSEGIFTPSGAIIKAGDLVDGQAVPGFVGVENGTFLSLGDNGTVVFNTVFPRNSSCFVGRIAVMTQQHIIGESCDIFAGHQVRFVTALDESINSAGDIVFDAEYVPEEKDAIILASACGLPSITSVSASPSEIWPPNRKMIPVTIGYNGSSSCNASYSLTVTSTGGSSSVTDASHVELQAVNDTVYTITITGTNSAGKATASVQVTVPRDLRP
jgi:hypothetical protein